MTAKFTACITGNPEPEYEWFRNGEKLWATDRILMDYEGSLLRLSIYNVDDCDDGIYSLRIFNPHGEDTCQAAMIYESKLDLILLIVYKDTKNVLKFICFKFQLWIYERNL